MLGTTASWREGAVYALAQSGQCRGFNDGARLISAMTPVMRAELDADNLDSHMNKQMRSRYGRVTARP